MKEEIRREVLRKRNSLRREEIEERSKIIFENIYNLEEFENAKTVMTYINFGSEVSTKSFIEKCIRLRKRVVVPITNFEEKNIDLVYFENFDELSPNMFGILEPPFDNKREANQEDLDLIIVPGIAYDEKCNRVGFGKGYYDKFLSSLKKKILKIAPAFELQIVKAIPTDSSDVKMDKIITEERIISNA